MVTITELQFIQFAVTLALGIASSVGCWFAGRKSYKNQIAEQQQELTDGWKELHDLGKAKNEQLETQIKELVAENHKKDLEIAALSAKVDTLTAIFTQAIDRDKLVTKYNDATHPS